MDKFLSMLGLCRRAGKFQSGHDASFGSITKNKAKAIFLTVDASDRLKEEFQRTTKYNGRDIPCIQTKYTMDEIWIATHLKSAVFAIEDEGFAKKLMELIETN
ncbi:MAG: hypothetical protein PUD72_03560 [Oscillospiraceae bacterium]|nr:hypothetical protein [Oscillospiraceae bacterium]